MSNIQDTEAKWYVVHTYSSYENKVCDNIIKMVANMGLQDYILEVKIPIEEVMEVKNEKRKMVQRKLFPGYVMVKMIMTKQTLYLIRNTRGVTGFVGPGSKVPIPLSNEEVRRMGLENVRIKADIAVGDLLDIVSGPFEGQQGVAKEVDASRQKVKINSSFFNRENEVELDFVDVKKV